MPTLVGAVIEHQILLSVAVSIPDTPAEKDNPIVCQALLDTGAQGTHISKRVAKEVGLTPTGRDFIMVASGDKVKTETYRVRLDIPISSHFKNNQGDILAELNLRGMDLEVYGLTFQPPNYDVIIGMDFLLQAHFTMYGGQFILSS